MCGNSWNQISSKKFFFKISYTTPLHQIMALMTLVKVKVFSVGVFSAALPDVNRISWGYKGCTEAKETKPDQYTGMFLRYSGDKNSGITVSFKVFLKTPSQLKAS